MTLAYRAVLAADLVTAVGALEAAEEDVASIVRLMRRAGASWGEIALCMGRTRQAVWHRYRHLAD